MRHHDDRSYHYPNSRDADSRTWHSDRAFFSGLGESDDVVATTETPSGSPTRQSSIPWYQSLLQTAVPVLMSAYERNQMTRMNIARINSGQAPYTAEQYASAYQPPSAQLQVGPTAGATKVLLWIGGGVAVLAGMRAAKIL